jgi:hypothetical protein
LHDNQTEVFSLIALHWVELFSNEGSRLDRQPQARQGKEENREWIVQDRSQDAPPYVTRANATEY